ncbi:MAG: beta-hydroxyacyl-ACP dehydratase [Planctomycetaceae bacterium]|nr:beta-hydroxyacyl-ACP dehydratase [Planctomycetaceae bacterium]
MRWYWIDRLVEFEPGKRAVGLKNVSLAEDHLHDHWSAFPIMPVSLMIEGTAQTGGLLVGHAMHFKEKVVLGKISKAEFTDIVVPGDQLLYEVKIDTLAPQAALTNGIVWRNGKQIGIVDLMYSHVDQNMAGLKFPEENFVFTGQFQRLIQPFLGAANA